MQAQMLQMQQSMLQGGSANGKSDPNAGAALHVPTLTVVPKISVTH